MKTPRVSVVMPVYNGEKYLVSAVESVLAQTFEDFEFLAIDDGSTDRTPEILSALAERDSRLVVIRHENMGQPLTMNVGLERARGEYIARMDADDICMSDRFAEQVAYLDEHRGCVAVGSRVLMIDDIDMPIYVEFNNLTHQQIESWLWQKRYGGAICHPAAMIRSDALQRTGGYRDEFSSAEDFELWLRLSEVGSLENLNKILLKYRKHSVSISATRRDKQIDSVILALSDAAERRGLKFDLEKMSAHVRAWQGAVDQGGIHGEIVRLALMAGNRKTAFRHARLAVMAGPLSKDAKYCLARITQHLWLGFKSWIRDRLGVSPGTLSGLRDRLR